MIPVPVKTEKILRHSRAVPAFAGMTSFFITVSNANWNESSIRINGDKAATIHDHPRKGAAL
jgi:hypothetical protein